jgi:hypothetical protein
MIQKQEGINLSQSQTKRFEKMLAENPDMPGIRSALSKERQLDGFVQRLNERLEAEKKPNDKSSG